MYREHLALPRRVVRSRFSRLLWRRFLLEGFSKKGSFSGILQEVHPPRGLRSWTS